MAAPFESEIDRTTEGVAAPTSCQAEPEDIEHETDLGRAGEERPSELAREVASIADLQVARHWPAEVCVEPLGEARFDAPSRLALLDHRVEVVDRQRGSQQAIMRPPRAQAVLG
jgi:hypothetical protein